VKLFASDTPALLAKHLVGEHINSVSLATYGFHLQIGDISISCSERVFASIGNTRWTWEEAPSNGPWGMLVRKSVTAVELLSPALLRISLAGGDCLEIETVEGPYESVLFDFPIQGESKIMEIY
jgi:hypothetical protein